HAALPIFTSASWTAGPGGVRRRSFAPHCALCTTQQKPTSALRLPKPPIVCRLRCADGPTWSRSMLSRRCWGVCDGWKTSRVLPKSRSEEHTSELQSREDLVCRLLLEKKI